MGRSTALSFGVFETNEGSDSGRQRVTFPVIRGNADAQGIGTLGRCGRARFHGAWRIGLVCADDESMHYVRDSHDDSHGNDFARGGQGGTATNDCLNVGVVPIIVGLLARCPRTTGGASSMHRAATPLRTDPTLSNRVQGTITTFERK